MCEKKIALLTLSFQWIEEFEPFRYNKIDLIRLDNNSILVRLQVHRRLALEWRDIQTAARQKSSYSIAGRNNYLLLVLKLYNLCICYLTHHITNKSFA